MRINSKELIPIKFVLTLTAIAFGNLILKSPESAVLLCFVSLIFILFLKFPLKALSVFILLIPLSGTAFFTDPIMNIPGVKPLYLLSLFVASICIFNYNKSAGMPRVSFLFSIILIMVLVIAVIRSFQYLNIVNSFRVESLSSNRYFLSAMVRPLIYFLPFVVILKFAIDKIHIELVINSVLISIAALSLYLIYSLFFKIDNISSISSVSDYYLAALNIQRNGLANFYILGFPLVISRYFLKKDLLSAFLIAMCLVCVGFLYSRTAYLTVILSTVFYLIISNRKKYLPIIVILSLMAALFMSHSIIERIFTGINTGDRNEITAGRTDNVWLPLVKETISSPKKLLLGTGRYGILNSNVSKNGDILDVTHPHNMYLEIIVDSGIIGFFAVVPFLIYFFYRFLKSIVLFKDADLREYQYAIIVSMAAYFISGLTGRSLFPELNNSYFWLILALGASLLRVEKISELQKAHP